MPANNSTNAGNLGFENKHWQAADNLRGHMDAAEYKHVVLGLIFLKYISDAFMEHYQQLELWTTEPDSDYFIRESQARYEVLEDRDEYVAENIFWVPKEARWTYLQGRAKQPEIGQIIDDSMVFIEQDNPSLKGVLPKDYTRPTLDKQRLGQLIDLVGTIGLGDKESRSKDILGRVYEYFLCRFAEAEGKRGGQFYTTRSVVELLVRMLEPYGGRIYDPCCGSGGMFVQSEKFVEAHGGGRFDLSIYGQESNPTTWRLCKMNLAIRGIESDIGPHNGDSFLNDLHPDLRVDFILANPPFNMKAWGGEQLGDDVRWNYGQPPKNNANYAWVQHMIHHLAPNGRAGFVLANGSMSSTFSGEGEIRKAIIEADLVDCMVALPGQLFYTTQIPVCLWFLDRDKSRGTGTGRDTPERDRRGETLFIDARQMGQLIDRTHRELTKDDLIKIAGTYHAWRSTPPVGASGHSPKYDALPVGATGRSPNDDTQPVGATRRSPDNDVPPVGATGSSPDDAPPVGASGRSPNDDSQPGVDVPHIYEDIPGFCKSTTLDEIRAHDYVLTPGRYVGLGDLDEDDEPFEEKMMRLALLLNEQFDQSNDLEIAIRKNLKSLGYD